MYVRNWRQNKYCCALLSLSGKLRSLLRELSGDAAYERYLVHWHVHHQGAQPLDRKAFYELRQREKWSGINRCC